ncbi:HlyD family secretion protein [Panacagrimonas sp.]|uniref:HlyD family secretion protein n=1 Tax=Panacagrimonas sp. TaxID=2480088 RepID=UPI003B51D4B6
MFVSRYRKFDPGPMRPLPSRGGVEVDSASGGEGARLSERDYALAQLFDGERDLDGVRQAAAAQLGMSLTPASLEGFAHDLALAGLLRAGSREPLPVPVQSDDESRWLGWETGQPGRPAYAGMAHPPSMLPASRHGPGLTGGLTGLVTGRRGQANQVMHELSPAPYVALGQWLLWPLMHRVLLWLFLALVAGTVFVAVEHHLDWREHLRQGYGGFRILIGTVLGAYLINLFSTVARAAAIARYTPEHPRVGLVFGFGALRIPRLFVDTAGAAERGDRATRLRVVGAGLVGIGALFCLAVLVWFVSDQTQHIVARYAVVVALMSLAIGLFRLNPLAQYDGYFLLCNALRNLDLRNQAITTLFGVTRPWLSQARPLSRPVLIAYALAVLAFVVVLAILLVVFVGDWVVERFNGTGFLFALAVSGAYMQKQYIRSSTARSSLGWPSKRWRPSRPLLIGVGIVALLCLIPYPYAPSGDFQVLPRDRADVAALTAGDVREVLAQEGDVVQAGQAIVKLDDAAQRAKVAASEAELARMQSELSLLKKGARNEEIEVARQRVATARAASAIADSQARRIAQAYKGKSVTPQEYDRAQGAAEVARQQLLEAERGLELVSSPAPDERIVSLQSEVQRVEADLAYQRQELEYTTIEAPISGRIVSARLQFARGVFLNRGELLATIEDTGEVLAEIRMPESSIGEIEVDAPATAKPWAYPGTSFEGRVTRIAPAAEEDRYGKIVRVQVSLADPEGRLKSGMTGNAKVDAGWQLAGIVFTKAIARFLLVEVWSWIP